MTLAGFGRSGYGDYGYTTLAGLTDRRVGQNIIDSFQMDDLGGGFPALFRFDFDSPASTGLPGGSLGNNLETLIGPGDSGGPLLLANGQGYALVGVNTFVEGYGGHFGEVGGGVVLEPYLDWIGQTTGLPVPEPTALSVTLLGFACLLLTARLKTRGHGIPLVVVESPEKSRTRRIPDPASFQTGSQNTSARRPEMRRTTWAMRERLRRGRWLHAEFGMGRVAE